MGSEAARYLLGSRFPVDTRKLENKKTDPAQTNAARAAQGAGRDFQGNWLGVFFFKFVVVLLFFFFLMERLELRHAFVWTLGGFFPEKYVSGRGEVATPEEGRVNI